MRHTFESRQWLPFPVPTVFAFFANPANLPRLMPAWQRARIDELNLVAPPAPPPGSPAKLGSGVGTTMVLSFRALPFVPLRMRWHAVIPEFVWNDHFCDEQPSGPFAYWRHCHSVRGVLQNGVEGTEVHDHVTYAFPLGPLGDVANLLGGRAQIASIFRFRQRQTELLVPEFAKSLQERSA